MERRTRLLLATAAFAAVSPVLGGCVNLMEQSAKAKPEWFEAAAREVKGEGYPKLSDAPTGTISTADQLAWEKDAADLKVRADALKAANATAAPGETAEDIRARAAQLRAKTGQVPATAPAKPGQP